ncbi:MAG: hypothetical protein FD153_461 [Rhodospirillaceae bacterium]|nr:MAG: hypothetical protein FD153_461 [Rhodospirillaceae bacterium]
MVVLRQENQGGVTVFNGETAAVIRLEGSGAKGTAFFFTLLEREP